MAARRKTNPETLAIIEAIQSATAVAKAVSDSVAAELLNHTQHDDERFDRLTTLVESIAADTKSLLASRSYIRGAWKAVVITAATVSGAITLLPIFLTYMKGLQ